jgi:hypothetical protein
MEEHILGVFENRVLRKIFRPKRDEVTGENNVRTESNIWSQVPEWARYLDIMTDRPSVVM